MAFCVCSYNDFEPYGLMGIH